LLLEIIGIAVATTIPSRLSTITFLEIIHYPDSITKIPSRHPYFIELLTIMVFSLKRPPNAIFASIFPATVLPSI
jgi:hypothetical protein